MAEFGFKGLDELRLSLKEVAELPTEVVDEMLNAGADVLVPAQRRETAKLGKVGGYRNAGQKRDYSTGGTERAIKKGRVKIAKNGSRVLYITPAGSRTRHGKTTRNAEVAFLNEFGTRTIHARGFMKAANEQSAGAVEAAEAAVYDKWLQSKNL